GRSRRSAGASPRDAPPAAGIRRSRTDERAWRSNMVRFRSRPISEHEEAPVADDGRLEELVAEAKARGEGRSEKASYVVSVGAEREARVSAAQLAEIVSLVQSQGDRLVGSEICHLARPTPRTLLGKGQAREIAAR